MSFRKCTKDLRFRRQSRPREFSACARTRVFVNVRALARALTSSVLFTYSTVTQISARHQDNPPCHTPHTRQIHACWHTHMYRRISRCRPYQACLTFREGHPQVPGACVLACGYVHTCMWCVCVCVMSEHAYVDVMCKHACVCVCVCVCVCSPHEHLLCCIS